MRVVFMGTPEFAVAVLRKLVSEHEVVAVVSQPDRAKDRKGNYLPTPVKEYATSLGITTLQFERIREHVAELKELGADIFVTAAYGQILPKEIIDLPRYGIVNVHASMLPRYRGSSPIQTAILNGDKATGVTIMQTDIGTDTGDILASREVEIGDMNAGELSETLAETGGQLLIETLRKLTTQTVTPVKQNDALASKCAKIPKEAAELDFSLPNTQLYNRIRAFNPRPVAFTNYNGVRVKIYKARCVDLCGDAGKILSSDKKNGLVVACGVGALEIIQLQMPGKKIMSYTEFLNGNKLTVGDYFGK